MIIAITGGTGFVGRSLAFQHAVNGDSVRVLTRQKRPEGMPDHIQFYHGDISDPSVNLIPFVKNADILYHCAAQLQNKKLMARTHIDGTVRLLNAAAGKIGRWVQLSSVGVYGPCRKGVITEETPNNPRGEYEKTKANADEIILKTAPGKDVTYTILRPSNIYGPKMKNQSVFQLIKMIDRNLFFFVGHPGVSANYLHVDNVVKALIQCAVAKTAENEIFNISQHSTLENFVAIICSHLGKKVPGIRLPAKLARGIAGLSVILPGFPLTRSRVEAMTVRAVYPNEKIKKMGYRHIKTLETGLSEMVNAYKSKQNTDS